MYRMRAYFRGCSLPYVFDVDVFTFEEALGEARAMIDCETKFEPIGPVGFYWSVAWHAPGELPEETSILFDNPEDVQAYVDTCPTGRSLKPLVETHTGVPLELPSPRMNRADLERMHDESLDDIYGDATFDSSRIIKAVSPVHYRLSVNEYAEHLGIDTDNLEDSSIYKCTIYK
ncbi:MAG: hypothetical protein ACRDQA_01820 [Nocardioidaceae bacterium]